MHPAYSVIFFTTASGAGYGLLIWLAIAALTGGLLDGAAFTVLAFGVSVVLIAGGLLSSTFHLGRPERAWRAFSQWRTSWLSREGVAAVATFVPMAVFGLTWLAGGAGGAAGALVVLGALGSIVGALITLWCTGMIYASLRTIPAWNRPLVAPGYVVLALATGGVLYTFLAILFGQNPVLIAVLTVAVLALGWIVKVYYWADIDNRDRVWTAEDATGLGRFGQVRQIEPPHTQANYVMREMGFKIARKHADKLRSVSVVLLFIAPALLTVLAIAAGAGLAFLAMVLAVLSAAIGVFTERWLFFAEAEHIVTVYYDGGAV